MRSSHAWTNKFVLISSSRKHAPHTNESLMEYLHTALLSACLLRLHVCDDQLYTNNGKASPCMCMSASASVSDNAKRCECEYAHR